MNQEPAAGPAVTMRRSGDHVVEITLDRPPVNALDVGAMMDLRDAVRACSDDLTVRVAVVSARGKCFCAGGDLKTASQVLAEDGSKLDLFEAMLKTIEAARMPVIAAVNGACVGAGLEVALACDLRIASDNACFIAAGVNVGLIASSLRLPRAIGAAAAHQMLYSGARMEAAWALRCGLVSELYPAGDLHGAATALAERIASRAPLSVEANKAVIRTEAEQGATEAEREFQRQTGRLLQTSDHREAVRAFTERDDPKFTRS